MKNVFDLFEEAASSWRSNKGKGTAIVPNQLNPKILVYTILTKLYEKDDNTDVLIVTETFNDRVELIEFLTHQEDEDNNAEFKKLLDNKILKVFSSNYYNSYNWKYNGTVLIWYCPITYSDYTIASMSRYKFSLTILSSLFKNPTELANLYKVNPLLDCFRQAEIDEIRVSSPVEEKWVEVVIPEDSEDWKLYQYYTKYIETSLNIFGSFDIIKQARVGNESLNISAISICNQIAIENGWNEHLDMNYEFNQKLDELYNPNSLKHRASETYEVIRNRANLISDYDGKLEKILNIVNECSGDKILIINKRGEFANKVTEYLNNNSETEVCGNYHNKMDDIEAVDIDGNPIFIKSGQFKGKRKTMGYKAQMTLNEKKFNLNKIRCLSLSNAPDKSLNVSFDTIIITSPLSEDIKSYLYRLSNIKNKDTNIKLFSIFCKNTIEQQRLVNKPISENHIIVNKTEIMASTENKVDFSFVD